MEVNLLNLQIPSPLQKLSHPLWDDKNIEVFIKRDDLIHPSISGNKWRKLKYNIENFYYKKNEAILTFGGAYSNHIAATASIGKLLNIPTIGIIRGEELDINSNQTLLKATKNNMNLVFVSRDEYSLKNEKYYHQILKEKYGNIYIIEEGGANFNGLIGSGEITNELNMPLDYIYTAAGTGTTTAGLLFSSNKTTICTVPVFKNGNFIKDEIKKLLFYAGIFEDEIEEYINRLEIETRFHFGGYGKFNQNLIDFINEFEKITNIKLDQIYTGKIMYSFMQHVIENKFKNGDKIVLLHTGGIQGLSSIKEKINFQV